MLLIDAGLLYLALVPMTWKLKKKHKTIPGNERCSEWCTISLAIIDVENKYHMLYIYAVIHTKLYINLPEVD